MKQQKKHTSFRSLLSERGMTLLEVMVAAGILGVISLGVIQLNQNMTRSSKRMNQQLDIAQLVNKVQPYVSFNDTCRESFRHRPLVEDQPATRTDKGIVNSEDRTVINVGDRYGNLTINGIMFDDVGPVEPPIFYSKDPTNPTGPAVEARKRSARIKLDIRRGVSGDDRVDRQATIGTLVTSQYFEVTFFVRNVAPFTEILDCHGLGTGYAQEACNSLKGIFDGDRCRSIDIMTHPTNPSLRAANFQGNVNIGPGEGAPGTLNVAGVTTLSNRLNVTANGANIVGATTISGLTTVNNGRLNVTNVTNTGGICLNLNCVTTWNVRMHSCQVYGVAGNSDYQLTCPNDLFMIGMGHYRGYNPQWMTIKCCRLHVR